MSKKEESLVVLEEDALFDDLDKRFDMERAYRQNRVAPVMAARMYIVDGMSFDAIVEELERMGQKRVINTVKRWAKEGIGNDGVPWDETRKQIVTRVRSASAEATVEELRSLLKESVDLLMERLRTKKARANFSDLPKLAEFLMKVESLDEEKVRFMKVFVREAARIIARHVKDSRVLGQIAAELDDLVDRLASDMLILDTKK
ncbi:MAG: hypothetical protein KatS3mg104_2982 [Phycisphaerae bacterium]|nr:MAG: hypothetical protein KatS3mg104_2982 [Phycisphaerae bacterium]